jgi:hypothetical protein
MIVPLWSYCFLVEAFGKAATAAQNAWHSRLAPVLKRGSADEQLRLTNTHVKQVRLLAARWQANISQPRANIFISRDSRDKSTAYDTAAMSRSEIYAH